MRPTTHASFIVAGLLGVGLAIGSVTGALADRADPYQDLDVFAQVLSQVEAQYVEEIPQRRLIDGAIEGMIGDLDPHSRWLDADAYRALQAETEGRYVGIGVEVRTVAQGMKILRVLRGGPAAREGLQPGDVLLAVDGVTVADLEPDEVSRRLRGTRGTVAQLTLQRAAGGDPVVVPVVRDRIDIDPIEAGPLPGGIAYVRLTGFQEGAARQVERSVQRLQEQGYRRGLVLDLRDNPGGLLDEAVRLTDLFLDEGLIVSTRSRIEGEQVHPATRGGFGPDLPVVVLVNGSSASASEVVTGALQDTGRATIVGTRTFGKGTVQTLFPNRAGSALKLTIGRYYTPNGTPVAPNQGRLPDVEVPHPAEQGPKERLTDALTQTPGLAEAERAKLLALTEALPADTPIEPVLPWDVPLEERLDADPQLQAALQHLQRSR